MCRPFVFWKLFLLPLLIWFVCAHLWFFQDIFVIFQTHWRDILFRSLHCQSHGEIWDQIVRKMTTDFFYHVSLRTVNLHQNHKIQYSIVQGSYVPTTHLERESRALMKLSLSLSSFSVLSSKAAAACTMSLARKRFLKPKLTPNVWIRISFILKGGMQKEVISGFLSNN